MRKTVLIILLFASACSKKDSQKKSAVYTLKEMGELATVEYTVTKIIKVSDNKTWFKLGDRKILMSCEATIKAGVDMTLIKKDNIVIQDDHVQILLPAPKIISLSIPPDKIKIEYQEVSGFRDKFTSGERDALATQAETQIKNSVGSLGIIEQAKANTSLFVRNYLQKLGYENIDITYSPVSELNKLQ